MALQQRLAKISIYATHGANVRPTNSRLLVTRWSRPAVNFFCQECSQISYKIVPKLHPTNDQVVPKKSKSFECLWIHIHQIFSKAGFVERLSVGAVLGAGGGEEPVARFFDILVTFVIFCHCCHGHGAWCWGRSQWQGFANLHLCSLLLISAFFYSGHFHHGCVWYHIHIRIPSFFSTFSSQFTSFWWSPKFCSGSWSMRKK